MQWTLKVRTLAVLVAAALLVTASGLALAGNPPGSMSQQRHVSWGAEIPCNLTMGEWGCNHATSLCDPDVPDTWCFQECIPGGQGTVHVKCMSPSTAAGW